MKYFMHDTSIVDEGAQIGDGTKIWHWSHICSGAHIGSDCILGQNTYVGNNVIIGNNVKIQNNVSVYDNVILDDNVFCGPSIVFTNVHNPRSEFPRKDQFKNTHIKKGVTLGANCTIVCGVTIGKYAFIGAGAVVTKDVKDYALMMGVPAVQVGWMTRYGERLSLPLKGEGKEKCKKTKDIYRLAGDNLYME